MNNFRKILLIVIFFSSCSFVDRKQYHSNDIQKTCFNQNYLNINYIGMTREKIIYIFGMPIISDSFQDVYHYCFYDRKDKNFFQKKLLNLYFQNNKVISFNINDL
ncbi:MAG: outer membrane protein assembly factor BamE [Buchnera aphidicola (Brevicoryne brassicae)]|uniref:Outer membrane protein assembly factor BamE n=1 Tax=Buchnera aphidicola (Brevicoryne brassicae) TaxID=911343 RepID=A0AAJ5PUK9_9GAMM|nr:outer membrane protein assembly factor BamE [Buchnera aphidicola]QCI19763.1 outer membrane protein assembly factor BamE [Buchnera aphidicola (Brevicoryne brassicae)]WAI19133.1 MAG: outer membrane protein assembly factor BamE [Buchnera aphidicola (Brevicoryne brassicae)]